MTITSENPTSSDSLFDNKKNLLLKYLTKIPILHKLVKKVKLATLVEGDPGVLFLIVTTSRC